MLFDTHSHLQFPEFDNDREEVIERTKRENVFCINVGTNKDFSQKAVELAEKHSGFFAAIGFHPLDIDKEDFDGDFYERLANHPKVLAIGECGLDVKASSPKEKQKEIFQKQIFLSKKIQKPLMIHSRHSYPEVLEILRQERPFPPGIVHYFSGDKETAKKFLELNFYLSFAGAITYNNQYDEVIKFAPLEKILTETDSPFVAPAPYRGKRNEPIYVKEVVKKLAEIKNLSFEEMSKITFENARKLFKINR